MADLINFYFNGGIKNSLRSLAVMLFGLIINKNIGFLLMKNLENQQLIASQTIVTLPNNNMCFSQLIEILMEADPVPFTANLLLFYYERK